MTTESSCRLAGWLRKRGGLEDPGLRFAGESSDRGQWMMLHGAPLLRDGGRRVAVIVERADPDRRRS